MVLHIPHLPDTPLVLTSVLWAAAELLWGVLPPVRAGWCRSSCLRVLVWLRNKQLVEVSSVCSTAEHCTSEARLQWCRQIERGREGGIRVARGALICLSPLQCLTEDAGWAGRQTGLRKHYISITVLSTRVLWLCRLFSLAVSSPLWYFWSFSPVLICPSCFPAAVIHCKLIPWII